MSIPIEPLKILVVEDDGYVLDANVRLIQDLYSNAKILTAQDLLEGIEIAKGNPDLELVLLDLHIPERLGEPRFNGLEALHAFRKACTARVAVLSGDDRVDLIHKALNGVDGDHECAASSYILKASRTEELRNILDFVIKGGNYEPRLRRRPIPGDAMIEAWDVLRLTPQQYRAARYLSKGFSNKEIARLVAQERGRSESYALPTIKSYVQVILRQLGVRNRGEAIAEMGNRRLIFQKYDFAPESDSD